MLGHFYFTKFLMPLLLSTSEVSPDRETRVINTSPFVAYTTSFEFDFFLQRDQQS